MLRCRHYDGLLLIRRRPEQSVKEDVVMTEKNQGQDVMALHTLLALKMEEGSQAVSRSWQR